MVVGKNFHISTNFQYNSQLNDDGTQIIICESKEVNSVIGDQEMQDMTAKKVTKYCKKLFTPKEVTNPALNCAY